MKSGVAQPTVERKPKTESTGPLGFMAALRPRREPIRTMGISERKISSRLLGNIWRMASLTSILPAIEYPRSPRSVFEIQIKYLVMAGSSKPYFSIILSAALGALPVLPVI